MTGERRQLVTNRDELASIFFHRLSILWHLLWIYAYRDRSSPNLRGYPTLESSQSRPVRAVRNYLFVVQWK